MDDNKIVLAIIIISVILVPCILSLNYPPNDNFCGMHKEYYNLNHDYCNKEILGHCECLSYNFSKDTFAICNSCKCFALVNDC